MRCNGLMREAMEGRMLGKRGPGRPHTGMLKVLFGKEIVLDEEIGHQEPVVWHNNRRRYMYIYTNIYIYSRGLMVQPCGGG